MYSMMMLTFRKKELLSSVLKYTMERQYVTSNNIGFSMRLQFRQFSKDNNVSPVTRHPKSIFNETPSTIERLLKKFGIHRKKYQLISMGYLLYGNIIDTVDYSAFYKDFKMADTFFSWFLITELHVWMLMVRYMGEGKDGKAVRDNLLEAMWIDVEGRLGQLCPMDAKTKRKQLLKLTGQFYTALLYYDEGILSDDKVLAAAIWTIFFVSEGNDPEKIETLLIYVRKQMYLLDQLTSQEIFCNPYTEWVDLKSVR